MLIARNSRSVLFCLVLAASPATAAEDVLSAREALDLTPSELSGHIERMLNRDLTPRNGDVLALLAISRSAVVVPILVEGIEKERAKASPSAELIAQLPELIAYAGDQEALLAIDRLVGIDHVRFGGLVDRALTHATNWRNPFSVAYAALGRSPAIAPLIAEWASKSLESDRMVRLWLSAPERSRSGQVQGPDPLLSRLPRAQVEAIQDRMTAIEAAGRKEQ